MKWLSLLCWVAFLLGCGGRAQQSAYSTTPSESAAADYGGSAGGEARMYETSSSEESMDYAEDEEAPRRRFGRGSRSSGGPPPPPAQPAARPVTSSSGNGVVAESSSPARMEAPPAPGAPAATSPVGTPPPPPPVPPPHAYRQQVPVVRALTAASVGDVDRRGPYLSYLSRHPAEAAQIGLDMSRRVRFRVLDQRSRPIHDAVISFNAGGARVEGRTHADGYWDFFPGVSAPQASGPTQVTVQWRNQRTQRTVVIPPGGDGPEVAVQLPQAAAIAPSTLDLAFLIDVTGSMGDELAYVNAEVQGIVQQVRQHTNQVNVRVAATFYRDRGDINPLQQINFTTDIAAFNAQMGQISAGGGGDYPEDVNAGLGAAITTLNWSATPAVRVLVLIADAPPQNYPQSQYTYRHAVVDASRRGIRILPVAASGSDRVVEYLFRAMGAITSTPYVYLTDDSGIGGHHMEADTDRISVEMFSDLLTRMLISDLQGHGMHEPSHAGQGQQIFVPVW